MKIPTLLRARTFLGLVIGACAIQSGCDPFQNPEASPVAALTVQIKGDFAGGTISSQPAGIDCGTTCTTTFSIGSKVDLTAQPLDSHEFVGWEGACTGSSPTCSLALDAGKSVTASFRNKNPRANIQITFGGAGGGSVTSMPVGLQCSGDCTGGFDMGTSLTLTAAPDSTSYFTGWTGACTGSARTCTLTLSADASVTANFGNPTSCEQLRADDPTLTNGNRKLFISADKTKPFDVYCHMAVIPALTYLNLTKTAATENFSQFTIGGAASGTTVKTNYTKVRIDTGTLRIDTNDKRFATSVGAVTIPGNNVTSMPYGTAMGCMTGNANGLANIDLTGTSFAPAASSLALGGTTPTGVSTPVANGQLRVLSLTGGGNCGWHAPTGATNPYNAAGSPLQLVYFP